MTDDEKVRALVQSLVKCLNSSALPLSVKELALENIQLRLQIAEQYKQEGGEKSG